MMDNSGYKMLLPFDTDNPEFARGFEAGSMWERIKNDHTTWDQIIHATNAEMVMRMCEAKDREFRAESTDDEDFVRVWIE